jgi:hypothetical protein
VSELKTAATDPLSLFSGLPRKKRPPVHLWNPDFCGDIDMRIARDGTWFYMGSPIGRPALVQLFAGILKREDDKYFLVTPVEKVGIRVEDAPFVAVELEVQGAGAAQILSFRTNVDEVVTAGQEHPIRVTTDAATGQPAPYLMVRSGLEALIGRAVFYQMVDLGVEVDGQFGVWSGGRFFALGRLDG